MSDFIKITNKKLAAIKKFMKKYDENLTVEDICERIKISPTTYYNMLSGRSKKLKLDTWLKFETLVRVYLDPSEYLNPDDKFDINTDKITLLCGLSKDRQLDKELKEANHEIKFWKDQFMRQDKFIKKVKAGLLGLENSIDDENERFSAIHKAALKDYQFLKTFYEETKIDFDRLYNGLNNLKEESEFQRAARILLNNEKDHLGFAANALDAWQDKIFDFFEPQYMDIDQYELETNYTIQSIKNWIDSVSSQVKRTKFAKEISDLPKEIIEPTIELILQEYKISMHDDELVEYEINRHCNTIIDIFKMYPDKKLKQITTADLLAALENYLNQKERPNPITTFNSMRMRFRKFFIWSSKKYCFNDPTKDINKRNKGD